jgi:lysosomal Pro-X carboxypeptidase
MKDYGSIQKSSECADSAPPSTAVGSSGRENQDKQSRLSTLPFISALLVSLYVLLVYFYGYSVQSTNLEEHTLASINDAFIRRQHHHNPEQPLFFDQIIDHNKPVKSGTFPQRFYMNNQYWTGPGHPIFIIFGGEGPLERILYPFISEILAKSFGGLTFNLEHRYFGVSYPHS